MTHITPEQAFLLGLSRMVWTKRAAAKASNLSFNEETITETILLDLKTSYPGDVEIVAFNKAQEATTGADWLWAFVSADGSQSLTMLVQAKRLDDTEQIYHGINRNIGTRTPSVRQIDQLLATARNQRIPAIYVFYNHVTEEGRIPRTCLSLQPSDPDQVLGFGISVAEASTVASVLPDEKFDVHRYHSIPLHCILCNGGSGRRPEGGTPEMAAFGLGRLHYMTSRKRDKPDNLGLQEGLHPMVKFALELGARRGEGGDVLTEKYPLGIAGVVVLRDSSEKIERDPKHN